MTSPNERQPDKSAQQAEADLRESEARHRLLLDSWAQAVWETNSEGEVVTDSPTWRAYTGQTLEEWLGYGWLDAIHPDDRDYAERQWREAIAARSLVDAEFRLRSPDGGYRWTNVRAAPVLDADGNIEKWAGMNIDIDDRKRAEAAVREVDQRYRHFFDATNVALVILEFEFDEAGNPTDFRHVHINPALEGISGFKREQILGRLVTEMASPEEAREWIDFYAPVLTSGNPAVLERFSPTMNRWIKVSAARFGPRQVAAVFENTTAQKSAEEALRASEERQAFLLQLSDALSSLTEPAEIQAEATRRLAERLNAGWCYFNEFDERGTHATVLSDFHRDDLPSMVGVHDLSGERAFLNLVRSAAVLDMPDLQESELFTERAKSTYGEIGLVSALGAPILHEGRLAAVLLVADVSVRRWRDGDVELLRGAAERTWTALQRARTERAVRENEERQAFLLRVSDAFRPLTDPAEVKTKAMELLAEQLDAMRASYFEFEEDEDHFHVTERSERGAPPIPERMRMSDFSPAMHRLFKSGGTLSIEDATVPGEFVPDPAAYAAIGVQALAGVGLLRGGRLVACIGVHSRTPRQWSPAELRYLGEVAERTWSAVEQARSESALRDREERLTAELEASARLQRLSAELIPAQDVRGLYGKLLEAATVTMHAQAATMQVYDKEAEVLRLLAHQGLTTESVESWAVIDASSNTACGPALRDNRRAIIADVDAQNWPEENLQPYRASGMQSAQSTPLISRNGRMLGMISTLWAEPHEPAETELRHFDILARQAADLIERMQADEALLESEERQAFLLKLNDALRPIADEREIVDLAVAMLAQELDADRAYVPVFTLEDDRAEIISQISRPGVKPHPTTARLSDYPSLLKQMSEKTLVIRDAGAEPGLSDADRQALAGVETAALIGAALRYGPGRPIWMLVAASTTPRQWSHQQIQLVEEVAERTWSAVEQSRAEAALRESEEKYRTLFETIDGGYALTDNVRDDAGRVVDLFGVDFNRSYTQHSGLPPFAGRRASEVITVEPEWLRQFEEVTRTGVPARYENYIAERDRWVSTHYSLVGDLGSDRVAVVFEDITERKRAERALRESEERQAFLLTLSDAIRTIADPVEIQTVALRLLAEHMSLSRAAYSEILPDQDRARRVATFDRDLPPVPTDVRISDFSAAQLDCYLQGQPFVVTDTETDDRVAATREACRAIQVRAWVGVPIVKQGELLSVLGIEKMEPYPWTDAEVGLVQEVTERTWAAAERGRIETTLRESEEQLRLIVESARDYAIFTTDADDVIDNWLPGAESVFGWSKEEAEGQSGAILFTPDDRQEGEPEREIETARSDGKADDVRWHLRKDGSLVFIEGQVVPLRGSTGEVHGFLKIGQDVTDRRMAENALRESEEQLRQFGEASQDILWRRDADTLQWNYLTPAFEEIYGLGREEALAGDNYKSWVDLILPEDRARAEDSIARVRQGEHVAFEYRIRRPSDGQIRWLLDTDFPIRDDSGRVAQIGGGGTDITERKRNEERQKMLLAELQHRVRNIMAMLRSIVRRTSMSKDDLEDFVQHLQGRIDAMARTQALLTSAVGRSVDLELILREELVAQAADDARYSISGPTVLLSPHAAEVLTLALHELATNSIKYGALGEPHGHIRIDWEQATAAGADALRLTWSETGLTIGDTDPLPGFGTELITRRIPYELGGRSEMHFTETGMTATIEFPLKEGMSILQTDAALDWETVK